MMVDMLPWSKDRILGQVGDSGWFKFASKAELAYKTLTKIRDKTEPWGLSSGVPATADTILLHQNMETTRCNRDNHEAVPDLLKQTQYKSSLLQGR